MPATVVPFLLRGVNLLGIDSVMQPLPAREKAWGRIAEAMPRDLLDSMVTEIGLEQAVQTGKDILKGGVKGRAVVDVNA